MEPNCKQSTFDFDSAEIVTESQHSSRGASNLNFSGIDPRSKYTSLKQVSLVHEGTLQDRPCITSTEKSKEFFRNYWRDNPAHDQEKFVVACLNTKHRLQSVVEITVGRSQTG